MALNLGYLFLRFIIYQSNISLTAFNIIITAILVFGSGFAYKGILEDHANNNNSNMSKKSKGGEALAGGASLDLLGLLTVVQYGSVLISEKFYWLLSIIPVWGGWKIYSTFFGSKGVASGLMGGGGGGDNTMDNSGNNDTTDKAADEKRQKRAERRRQKWS